MSYTDSVLNSYSIVVDSSSPQADPRPKLGLEDLLGSFWKEVFHDKEMLAHLINGVERMHNQSENIHDDIQGILSYENTPVLDVMDWAHLTLSDEVSGVHRYGEGLLYGAGNLYGESGASTEFSYYTGDPTIIRVERIMDSTNNPEVTLHEGEDFDVKFGVITFRERLKDTGLPMPDNSDGNIKIWANRVYRDKLRLFRYLGYIFRVNPLPKEKSRDALSELAKIYSYGCTELLLKRAIALSLGSDAFLSEEVIESYTLRGDVLHVVTDKNEYQVEACAEPSHNIGDVVRPGSPITQVFDILHEYKDLIGDPVPDYLVHSPDSFRFGDKTLLGRYLMLVRVLVSPETEVDFSLLHKLNASTPAHTLLMYLFQVIMPDTEEFVFPEEDISDSYLASVLDEPEGFILDEADLPIQAKLLSVC